MDRRRLLTAASGAGALSAVPLPGPCRGFRYEMPYNTRDPTSL
ncbi:MULTISPECIES: hypothetical protein [Streptomyces]|nr:MULTISPECIES: hypothetical protein [Streptomyces]WCL84162.1 hypothetical protein PPN52_05740 [Streptomyces sp. JCM 35825]